jgi:hypothetical protein
MASNGSTPTTEIALMKRRYAARPEANASPSVQHATTKCVSPGLMGKERAAVRDREVPGPQFVGKPALRANRK